MTLEPYSLLENVWLTMIIWGVLFFGERLLTSLIAQKQREDLNPFISYEGGPDASTSAEKNGKPWWAVGWRFAFRWLFSILAFYLIWWLSKYVVMDVRFFSFFVGMLMLRVGAMYLKDVKALATIYFSKQGGVEGHISYSRWFLLRVSGVELLGLGLLFFVLGVLFGSWFFYGGAFSQWLMGVWYWRLSKSASNQEPAAQA